MALLVYEKTRELDAFLQFCQQRTMGECRCGGGSVKRGMLPFQYREQEKWCQVSKIPTNVCLPSSYDSSQAVVTCREAMTGWLSLIQEQSKT